MELQVQIHPGKVRIASLKLKSKTRDLIWFNLDCNTKYYSVAADESDTYWELLLSCNHATLRASKRTYPTRIVITKPTIKRDAWKMILDPQEVARYGTRIYLIREKRDLAAHWIQNSRPTILSL